MTWDLLVSDFTFDDSATTTSPTARFSYEFSAQRRSGGSRVPVHHDYSFVLEDIADLEAMSKHWSEHGVPPSDDALSCARAVIAYVAGAFPPPEVTARENGTVLLLWHDARGFISIEIGERAFGLVSSRPGFPSFRVNGQNFDLAKQLPRRTAESEYAFQTTTAVTQAISGQSIRNRVATAVTRLVTDARLGPAAI